MKEFLTEFNNFKNIVEEFLAPLSQNIKSIIKSFDQCYEKHINVENKLVEKRDGRRGSYLAPAERNPYQYTLELHAFFSQAYGCFNKTQITKDFEILVNKYNQLVLINNRIFPRNPLSFAVFKFQYLEDNNPTLKNAYKI